MKDKPCSLLSSPLRLRLLAGLAAVALALPAAAADWQVVMKSRDKRVELDSTSVIDSDGGTKVAWARVVLPAGDVSGAGYAIVKALNRYDCNNRSFETIKRVYLDAGNLVLKEERVTDLMPLQVEPRSVDEALWREVCKPPAAADLKKLASAASHAVPKEAQPKTEPAQALHGEAVGAEAEAPAAKSESAGGQAQRAKPAPRSAAAKAAPAAEAVAKEEPAGVPAVAKRALPKAESVPASAPTPAPASRERAMPSASLAPVPAAAQPGAGSPRERGGGSREVASPQLATAPAVSAFDALPDWRYEEPGGPSSWAKMRSEWAVCGDGRRQAPINISDGFLVDLPPLKFEYRPSLFRELDDGHTLSLTPGPGNAVKIRGQRFELQRIEFHRPAEERIAGRSYEMDAQFVHRSADGEVAIVAVLLERGKTPNAALQTVWNNLPLERHEGYTPDTPLDLPALLPSLPEHFLYMGSLTRPPCTEGVLWAVMKQPVQISDDQMNLFARLYPMNARPVQPSYGRTILESR